MLRLKAGECIMTAAHHVGGAVRQRHGGGAVAGNISCQGETAIFALPGNGSTAVLGFKAAASPGQTAVRQGVNDKLPIARAVLCKTAYIAENPIVHGAVGVVVKTLLFRGAVGQN